MRIRNIPKLSVEYAFCFFCIRCTISFAMKMRQHKIAVPTVTENINPLSFVIGIKPVK